MTLNGHISKSMIGFVLGKFLYNKLKIQHHLWIIKHFLYPLDKSNIELKDSRISVYEFLTNKILFKIMAVYLSLIIY